MKSNQPEILYKLPEAAKILTIKPKSLYAWIYAGRIGHTRIGGRSIRIPLSEINRLIAAGYTPATDSDAA